MHTVSNFPESAFSHSPSPLLISNMDINFPSTPNIESAYRRGADGALTAANQIEADKTEARKIIAKHAVDPLEMLHLGELTTFAESDY
ncbi:unnamed protein product [Rotaria sp. Silwood2]|nr:unnamed protein product [Rotaria sp. Silwood2]CAF4384872.1 unnamed protein product [Rotaria sp. Silwood2]CAF4590314.1 unnamed protein product [Rotaria sp. Silwood2]